MATKNLNPVTKQDIQKSHAFLQQLWAIMNPYRDTQIDRLAMLEILLTLMMNISCKSKNEVTNIVAKQLIKYYESMCISLINTTLGDTLKHNTPAGGQDKDKMENEYADNQQ